jgi:hypothetical protein
MKYQTADLEGPALDAAVAKADAMRYMADLPSDAIATCVIGEALPYSTEWQHGGPLLEQHKIVVAWSNTEWWAFRTLGDAQGDVLDTCEADGRGPTYLVAGLRAFVASQFPHEIELP